MIAPVPVPPCGQCYDLSLAWRPWAWPPHPHSPPFFELTGRDPQKRAYFARLPAALDPSKP